MLKLFLNFWIFFASFIKVPNKTYTSVVSISNSICWYKFLNQNISRNKIKCNKSKQLQSKLLINTSSLNIRYSLIQIFNIHLPYVPSFFQVPYVASFLYVPYVPSFFYVLYLPYVPSFFTCLTCPHFFMCLKYFHFFYVPSVPSFFHLAYVPSFFLRALHAFIILRAYVSSFFTCLTCSHFYLPYVTLFFLRGLHDFIFARALPAITFQVFPNFNVFNLPSPFFIKCGTTQNQPQQAGISKNEVE